MKTLTIETFTTHRKVRDRHFWRIRAANGEILATSEGYRTRRARDETVTLILDGKITSEEIRKSVRFSQRTDS